MSTKGVQSSRKPARLLGVVLLAAGMLLLWLQWERTGPQASPTPLPQGSAASPGATAATAEGRMVAVQESLIAYLQGQAGMSRQEKLQALTRMLGEVRGTLEAADDPTVDGLCTFKFPVRRMAEEAARLDPKVLQAELGGRFTERGCRATGSAFARWGFDPLEDAVYETVFKDPEYLDPSWAMQVMLAERVHDSQRMLVLAAQAAEEGPDDRTKADLVRQLFSGYVSTHEGDRQIETALKVVDPARLKGATWADLGYGSGKVFRAVRAALGPSGKIVGVEIGPGYEGFVRRIMERHPQGWGQVDLVRGSRTDCGLPPESVDIVHERGIHVGDGRPESYKDELLPWLLSIKRALRPGGIMILNDCGSPPLDRARAPMRLAGFEEYRLWQAPITTGQARREFVVSFRKPAGPAAAREGARR